MPVDTIDGAAFPSHLREHAIDDYDQLASMYGQLYAESIHAGRPNAQHRADAERCERNAASLRNGGPITLGGRG
jgi:hypothetical protein